MAAVGLEFAAVAEVVIVGGGVAGSLLALTLGRLGTQCVLIDLHETYPADFRCEKLSIAQVAGLAGLGVADALEGMTGTGVALSAAGFRYDTMVNRLRRAWPPNVRLIQERAVRLETGLDQQTVTLSDGRQVQARLVVVAAGPFSKLVEPLGITRLILRRRHSMCVGFSLVCDDDKTVRQAGLVHHSERAGDGMGFASLFPMDGALRVNLFAYRDPTSPWARACLADPLGQLFEAMPRLRRRLTGARVVGPIETRATDLYCGRGPLQPGLVLIGDADRSSCPATGMGMSRIITDVALLSQIHIPAWLATPGVDVGKIAAFYGDEVKRRIDQASDRASEMGRRVALETTLRWRARRGLSRLKRAVGAIALRA